jgi:hypothetical protein
MTGPFRSAAQSLAIARAIADEHGLFFTEKLDMRRDGSRVTVWVLYRKLADGQKARLCKRSSPAALLTAVKHAAATQPTARRAA